jgi:uncharacterized protein involved in exopolysaccharide biosynthesis
MTLPNLDDWMEIVYRRRRTALIAGLAMFSVIAIGTLLWPPVYSSTCQILVQDNRAQLLVSPGLQPDAQQNPAVVSNPVNEQDLNSERELLTSTYLVKLALADLPIPASRAKTHGAVVGMMKAVIRLPLSGYGAMHDIPRVSPRDGWAMEVASQLSASVIKRSNILEIEYRSHERRWTKFFLDRLLSQYMDYHAHISHDPQAQRFFEEQKNLLEVRLESSEEKLRDFQLKTGIGNLEEQKHAMITRVSDLEKELASNVAQVSAADQQIATIESQLDNTSPRIAKETHSVQNLALQQLKPQVAQLRAERAELLSRYQAGSQRIKEINAKLASEEKILEQENHLEVNESSTDINPIWVSLETDLKQSTTAAASHKATRDEIQRQIGAAKAQLAQLTTNGVLVERLQRQVTSDQDTYRAYVRKSEEARAAEALNRDKILNVSLAQPPAEPLQPIFPVVSLNLTVGLLLALALALAAAYWAEERDPTIYSRSAVAEATGLPIVAIVSHRM